MAKYSIYGQVRAGKYLGEVEANSEEEARDKAFTELSDEMFVSVCHQCSHEVDDPEIEEVYVSEIKEEI